MMSWLEVLFVGWILLSTTVIGSAVDISDDTETVQSFLTDAERNAIASVDGDPDFIVGVQGLEQPLCFRLEGQPGHVIRLLQDPDTGVVVNARITRPVPGSRKTYLGAVLISRRNFRVVAKVGRVHVNRYRFQWGPVTVRLIHGHRVLIAPTLLALTLRNKNVTLIVKRHLPEGGLTAQEDDDDEEDDEEDNRASLTEEDVVGGEYANNANTLSWASRVDTAHGPNPNDASVSSSDDPLAHQNHAGRQAGQLQVQKRRRRHRRRHRNRGKQTDSSSRTRSRRQASSKIFYENQRNLEGNKFERGRIHDKENPPRRLGFVTYNILSGHAVQKNRKRDSEDEGAPSKAYTTGSKNPPSSPSKAHRGGSSTNTDRKPISSDRPGSEREHIVSDWADMKMMDFRRERRSAQVRPGGRHAHDQNGEGTRVGTTSVRPRDAAAYVGFYIADARDLSRGTHGLLGQFLHKTVTLQRVRRKSNGKVKAVLLVERSRPHRVKATLRTRTNLALNTSSTCWWLKDGGTGVVDHTYAEYLVPRFRDTDMLPLQYSHMSQ